MHRGPGIGSHLLLCVDSLLNRCYLLVSGSVRVRRGVVVRLGLGLGLGLVLVLRQGLGLALGLQLRIGIGFRCNRSWSSTFTPRRNHSLCLNDIRLFYFFKLKPYGYTYIHTYIHTYIRLHLVIVVSHISLMFCLGYVR